MSELSNYVLALEDLRGWAERVSATHNRTGSAIIHNCQCGLCRLVRAIPARPAHLVELQDAWEGVIEAAKVVNNNAQFAGDGAWEVTSPHLALLDSALSRYTALSSVTKEHP